MIKTYKNKDRNHKKYFYGQLITEKEIIISRDQYDRPVASMDGMNTVGRTELEAIGKIIEKDL